MKTVLSHILTTLRLGHFYFHLSCADVDGRMEANPVSHCILARFGLVSTEIQIWHFHISVHAASLSQLENSLVE